MTRRCALIANRGAGSFSEAKLKQVEKSLQEGGVRPETLLGTDFAEMTAMAEEYARVHEAPLVVAAGGDGTINAVFNGLAESGATAALIPLGTANVLAIELGVPTPEAAVSRIVAGNSRPFTAGVISTTGRTKRFFLMAGIGVDGAVVERVSLREKRLLGKGAYALAAFRHACAWDTGELSVATAERSFTCHSVVVCNTARYGGPLLLAPEASVFSPDLDVVAIRATSRLGYLKLIAGLMTGGGDGAEILRMKASEIRIEGRKPVQADGDFFGHSPVQIRTEIDIFRIIV
jgi:diacylglycerol kinase family enzyme